MGPEPETVMTPSTPPETAKGASKVDVPAEPRAKARAALAARVLEVLALPLIVLVATLLTAHYALRVDEWRVMTDEMLYLRIAHNMSETLSLHPQLHGVPVPVYSVLYPLLIAPLAGFFDLPTAVRLVHGLNALLMASTAIPAYLLTRWAVSRSRIAPPAVAALAVFVPWLTLSYSVMTEVVAYPMVVWAVYGLVRAVAEPSPKADAIAIAGVAGAFLARTQFVFLAAAFPAAVVVHELGFRVVANGGGGFLARLRAGIRAAFRGHIVLWVAAVIGLLLLLSGVNVYGSYSAVVGERLWPPEMAQSLLDHVNDISIGVGILPLALTIAFVSHALVRPRANARVHALAVVLLLVLPPIALIATSFDLNFGGHSVQERYVFYVVPFLFVGAAVCMTGHRPPFGVTVVAGAVTALAILQTEYQDSVFPAFASPTKFAYPSLNYKADQAARLLGQAHFDFGWTAALLAFAATVALALATVRGRANDAFAVVACGLCAWGVALFLFCAPRVLAEHEGMAVTTLGVGRPDARRAWIDRSAGSSASVGLVPSPINARRGKPRPDGTIVDQAVWWDAEFWNKSVDRTFSLLGAMTYTPFPASTLRIDGRRGRLITSSPLPGRLAVANSDVRFAPLSRSRVISSGGDLTLYQLVRPARAAWSTERAYANGSFPSGKGAKLTLYPLGYPSTRRVALLLDRGARHPGGYGVAGPGVRRSGRLGRRGVVRFDVCVPARKPWIGRIDLPATPTARLASVRDAPNGRCG